MAEAFRSCSISAAARLKSTSVSERSVTSTPSRMLSNRFSRAIGAAVSIPRDRIAHIYRVEVILIITGTGSIP
ncbi:hypothetical protein D3C76_1829060 [compost metagenome]